MWTHVALMDVTSVNLKVKTKTSHGVIYVSGFRLKSRFVFLYCQDIADKQNASGLMQQGGLCQLSFYLGLFRIAVRVLQSP